MSTGRGRCGTALAIHDPVDLTGGSLERTLVRKAPRAPLLEEARDELFSHILRSGVIGVPPEQRREWLADTMAYFAERYPDLPPDLLDLLRERAEHFCVRQPRGPDPR